MTEALQSIKKLRFLKSKCSYDCVLFTEIISVFTRFMPYTPTLYEVVLSLRNGHTLTYDTNIKSEKEAGIIYNNLVDYLEGNEIPDKQIESDRKVILE